MLTIKKRFSSQASYSKSKDSSKSYQITHSQSHGTDSHGPYRLIFASSSTVQFAPSAVTSSGLDISSTIEMNNTVPCGVWPAEETGVGERAEVICYDSLIGDECSEVDLRATLSVKRHSDEAVACLWRDLQADPLPEESYDYYDKTFGGFESVYRVKHPDTGFRMPTVASSTEDNSAYFMAHLEVERDTDGECSDWGPMFSWPPRKAYVRPWLMIPSFGPESLSKQQSLWALLRYADINWNNACLE